MEKTKAVIVENELPAIENLQHMIEGCCPGLELAATYQTYDQALIGIQKVKPQLVFLDIGLGGKSGFDLLKPLKHLYFEVIFTTISRTHHLDALRVEAVDYLAKPFTDEELIDAVDRAVARIRKNRPMPTFLHVPGVGKDLIIPFEQIMYCKAASNLTEVHVFEERRYTLASDTLKNIEEKLPSGQFYRIHKSHCVNRDYIKAISRVTGLEVLLKDDTKLEISRDRKEGFYEWLGI